jgi:ATP-binding cassette subfamily B protein
LYQNEISIGQFAVTLTGVEYMRTMLNQLLNNLDHITKSGVSIQNYYDFLDLKEAEGKREVCHPIHQIDFDHVSFQYSNGKNILSDLNLTIHQGETIAIIGRNGAGKTTFAKLVLGLLKPTSGTVRYNKKDISKIAEEDLFQQTSILFQTFGRYQFTLAENIILDEQIDQNKLEKADEILKKIGFDMKDRYTLDTMLGTDFGGVDLSGGQWQQLSLARAYYKNSEFIVLDEPTSAFDPIKESELLSNFRDICKQKTAILITHRLSAAKLADRILVMDQGKIIEMGSHNELMSKNGIYAKLYKEQASWYMR